LNSQVTTPNTDAAILARLVQARDSKSPDVTRYPLSIDFDDDETHRDEMFYPKALEKGI
jgi:hypothetical protein